MPIMSLFFPFRSHGGWVGTLKLALLGGGYCVVLLGSPILTECERNCSQGCLGRTCPRESCTLLLDFAHWIPIGETGATYLFLPLWNIPVQQRQGERGKAYSGTDMLRVVAASGRQQGFQKPTVFLSVRSRMYPSVFPL